MSAIAATAPAPATATPAADASAPAAADQGDYLDQAVSAATAKVGHPTVRCPHLVPLPRPAHSADEMYTIFDCTTGREDYEKDLGLDSRVLQEAHGQGALLIRESGMTRVLIRAVLAELAHSR